LSQSSHPFPELPCVKYKEDPVLQGNLGSTKWLSDCAGFPAEHQPEEPKFKDQFMEIELCRSVQNQCNGCANFAEGPLRRCVLLMQDLSTKGGPDTRWSGPSSEMIFGLV
jgi:hypothetical protein